MSIIIKPVITEKANKISELLNKYSFIVSNKVNKIQIKDAVQTKYGVSVKKVNVMNYGPARKLKHTKSGTQKSNVGAYKKALVQLEEGENIDFYSNL